MRTARDILGTDGALIGMVHVRALPGTPRHSQPLDQVIETAASEARTLIDCGCDALLIENMHDVPYLRRSVGPEIVGAMTAVGIAVRNAVDVPLGVQVLAGANEAALAVAQACGAQFIRAEGFVFASVADEGLLAEAAAGPLLRYRRQIGADDIAIFADIRKKHTSHAITADLSGREHAQAAEFCGADGVIVTGAATGMPVDLAELTDVRATTDLPVLVGSGLTANPPPAVLALADAFIVGSAMKREGRWDCELDPARIRAISEAIRSDR